MKFKQDFIEKVREANNLVDVIGQFTQLKPASSGQHMGICPYPDHNEKTGSFSVSEGKQVYFCFGCKKSGNIFSFVQDLKGLSFPETIEYLASRASLPLTSEVYEEGFGKGLPVEKKDHRRHLLEINAQVSQRYQDNLKKALESSPIKKYIAQRGLSQEVIETFSIGYSTSDWENLGPALKAKGVDLHEAQTLGLVKALTKTNSNNKSGYFDIFRNRLMFPIVSHRGDVVGFGGRVIDNDDKPKYLNSPESEVFHKGKTFYGLFETAKYIRSQDWVIVVEGYMDLVALYSAGIFNVVATLGTALTIDHAKLLKRYTKNVVVLFDGDQAGQVAAERSLPVLLAAGVHPKGLVLPDGMDPDDYLKKFGVKDLKQKIGQAKELFTMIMEKQLSNFKGEASEKVAAVDKLAPLLAAAADKRLRDLYVSELKERLFVDMDWLRSALREAIKDSSGGQFVQKGPTVDQFDTDLGNKFKPLPVISVINPPKAELYLLNLALKNEKNFEKVFFSGVLEQFSHVNLRELFHRAQQKRVQIDSEFDKLTASLINEVEPKSVLNHQFEHHLASLTDAEEARMIEDCCTQVKRTFIKNKTKALAMGLSKRDPNEQLQQLKSIMDLQKSKLDPEKSHTEETE